MIDNSTYEMLYEKVRNKVPDFQDIFIEPKDDAHLLKLCKSKLWRLNNLYSIVDKKGRNIPFVMNFGQHWAYSRLLYHPRLLILKSRQYGISTFFLIDYLDDAIFEGFLQVGMQSYGLEESYALLEKLNIALADTRIKYVMGLLKITAQSASKRAKGFNNNSKIRVQLTFRGDTLHRLHVSELGKIAKNYPKRAEELKTGTLQAIAHGNPVVIESTAEGKFNEFHNMWIEAESIKDDERSLEDFYPAFIPWMYDPSCQSDIEKSETQEDVEYFVEVEKWWGRKLTRKQKNWALGKRRLLGKKFNQEYPYCPAVAFQGEKEGYYYAALWKEKGKEIGDEAYNPSFVVYTSWDIGVGDSTEIVFWQLYKTGNKIKAVIIDHYSNSGKAIDHYCDVIKSKPYEYKYHILPWDAEHRSKDSAKTITARLIEEGLKSIIVNDKASIEIGIEAVRTLIPYLEVNRTKCPRIIQMFNRYCREFDEKLNDFKEKPKHDEWSHPADAVRAFAMSPIWPGVGNWEKLEGEIAPSRKIGSKIKKRGGLAF